MGDTDTRVLILSIPVLVFVGINNSMLYCR